MRIALIHPVYWPEVHRGSERIVNDIGRRMAARGHEVTLITSHRGRSSASHEDGMRVLRGRRPRRLPGMGLYELFLETVPGAAWQLLRGGYEAAHAFHLSSAALARRGGGPPFAYSFHGIPTRTYLTARRRRIEMLRLSIEAAAAVTVLSEAAAQVMRRHLLTDPELLPAGVDLSAFAPGPEREPEPMILYPASFTDPRKRAGLLLEAFAELRRERRQARLVLADNPDPAIGGGRPRLPEGARWADLNAPGALEEAYRRAWVTALPSVDEAQGLVLLQSLASGTPFVAARSGAPPQIHGGRQGVGRLFDPDDRAALVRALGEALDLAASDGTRAACLDRAAGYSWQRLEPAHEDLYLRLAEAA